jgi:hypothetical protein
MAVSDDDIVDAYLYLLGRFLVLRQENHDIRVEQAGYNTIKYNPLGAEAAEFVNPNLDVAYLEAWIAVDPDHAVVMNVPPVVDRYYTVQILDGWGEVIANVNQRTYPDHPHGQVAFVLAGTSPPVPDGAVRIDLPAAKTKILARVELAGDPGEALHLQRQFTLDVPDGIGVEPPVQVPDFTNSALLGPEIFTLSPQVLASYPDAMPSAAQHQGTVARVVAEMTTASGAQRVADVIGTKAVPAFFAGAKGFGRHEGGWSVSYAAGRFGDDILARDIINFGGLWANTTDEAIYFVGLTDATGTLLDGSRTYEVRFPADALPGSVVGAFWSCTLYSVPDYHVVPNSIDRWNLNSTMPLKHNPDGSLSLWLAPQQPEAAPQPNWLPTPAGQGFALTLRLYVSKPEVLDGRWFPPPLTTGLV